MKPCSVAECGRPSRARGFCKPHWNRWRRYGDPLFYPIQAAREWSSKEFEYLVGEIEWLRSFGVHPEWIAMVLKKQPGNLARYLYRHNRPDLAIMFEREKASA